MAKTRPAADIRAAAALYEGGRFREAEKVCRQLIRKRTSLVDAYHVLGVIAGKENRFDEARGFFARALKVDPAAATIHAGLGKLAAMEGRFEEAIGHYDRALRHDPEHTVALAGKAEALTRRGEYDAARALLEPFVESGRADAEIAFIYVETLQNADRHEEAIAIAERFDADRRTPNVPRRKILYALGKSYARRKRFDDAFRAYRRANELSTHPFDIMARRRFLDRVIATFSRERMARRPRSTNDSALPIFIVGMPRCGSTLVEQILAAHPVVHGAGEIGDLVRLAQRLPAETRSKLQYPEAVDQLDQATLDRMSHRHVGRLRQYDRSAERIVDKHLDNYAFLGLIDMLFPNARVIHCRRDPMSVCFSIYTLPLSPVSLPYSTDLRNLGLYYREYERIMAHWREALRVPLLEVPYEEVVADQEAWSRRLIDFCGLPWDDACLRFYETGRDVATASYDQVRRPIYKTSVKRYEAYGSMLDPLREALGER